MNAFHDILGEKLYGKLCYGPPHRLSGPDHALRCHFYRRRATAATLGVVVGFVAAVYLFLQSDSSDKGTDVGIAFGVFFAVATAVAAATYFIYGFVVTSGYHFYDDMYKEKKEMYQRAGDDETRAEVFADNDVANEFDRRKVAARYQ